MALQQELEELRAQTLDSIKGAASTDALEEVRVGVLGKKGTLTSILRGMRDLPKEERPLVGKMSNEVRDAIEAALEEKKRELSAAELEARMQAGAIDITLPGRSHPIGSQHLITHIIDEVSDIFCRHRLRVVEGGREIETDWYNFTALNAPKDHPSRSMQDTFYVVDRSGETSRTCAAKATCFCAPRPRARRSTRWSSSSRPST